MIIRTQQYLCLSLILCMVILLSGCHKTVLTRPKADSSVPTPQARTQHIRLSQEPQPVASETKNSKIGNCQSQLVSLKQINPKSYQMKQVTFNRLVNNVSVYSTVRGDVNSTTKETLDALYKYKTNQLCAEIERDVLQGLIQRGENEK